MTNCRNPRKTSEPPLTRWDPRCRAGGTRSRLRRLVILRTAHGRFCNHCILTRYLLFPRALVLILTRALPRGTIKLRDFAYGEQDMDIGEAVYQLKLGKKVMRNGWNGKGMWLEYQKPDENSKMTLPYVFMTTVQGDRVPWLASQTDLLAEDWDVVPTRT